MVEVRKSYASHAAAFAAGTTSPTVLAENALSIVAAREGDLRAFVTYNADAALLAAHQSSARWRAGQQFSALDGMLLGVKDVIETADFPTGQGAPNLPPLHGCRDAATVQALRAAGVIVLGKTVTTEFASTELFFDVRNPHDLARGPGGSSSGSAAAVGAGMVPLALGTQVVGSTLRPASYCGAFGFKPSFGALNRGGSFDYLSQSCVGLIGAALEDIWLAAREIARRAGGDPGHPGLGGPDHLPRPARPARLMVLRTAGWDHATDTARAAFEVAVARLAAAGIDMSDAADDPRIMGFEAAIAPALEITWRIMSREFVWPLGTLAVQNAQWVSAPMHARLGAGQDLGQAGYAAALAERLAVRARYTALMADYDGAITLAATGAAPEIGATTGNPGFNVPASLLGAPAASLPVLADQGLPLGLQVIGPVGGDARTIATAGWICKHLSDGGLA